MKDGIFGFHDLFNNLLPSIKKFFINHFTKNISLGLKV